MYWQPLRMEAWLRSSRCKTFRSSCRLSTRLLSATMAVQRSTAVNIVLNLKTKPVYNVRQPLNVCLWRLDTQPSEWELQYTAPVTDKQVQPLISGSSSAGLGIVGSVSGEL